MKQGKIFIICGPSGVGKGTIILGLLTQNQIPLTMIQTYTTRDPKPRDKATGHYRYITREQFLQHLKDKLFFESNFYNGNYYGTLQNDIDDVIKKDKIALREQDVEHALFTQKKYPGNVMIIFIDSSLEVIRQRLVKRGENSPEEINKRLSLAKKELDQKEKCGYIVENLPNDQEHTIQKVLEIIKTKTKS